MAATRSVGTLSYNDTWAGYTAYGRSFRFVSTTLTVPPRVVPKAHMGDAVIGIKVICPDQCGPPHALIDVAPGGGAGSVIYDGYTGAGSFHVSPQVGDKLVISVYYDQRRHDYFTATDLTQHTSQTVRLPTLGHSHVAYDQAELSVAIPGTVKSPAADTRLWKFAGTHLTTYTGVHGTIQGPWQTSEAIKTSDGTSTGAVVASPTGLRNGGQNFGVWLRHQ